MFIFFVEELIIWLSFLYPNAKATSNNVTPTIHIEPNTFSILTLLLEGMFSALLIATLFVVVESLIEVPPPKLKLSSCFEELV